MSHGLDAMPLGLGLAQELKRDSTQSTTMHGCNSPDRPTPNGDHTGGDYGIDLDWG